MMDAGGRACTASRKARAECLAHAVRMERNGCRVCTLCPKAVCPRAVCPKAECPKARRSKASELEGTERKMVKDHRARRLGARENTLRHTGWGQYRMGARRHNGRYPKRLKRRLHCVAPRRLLGEELGYLG